MNKNLIDYLLISELSKDYLPKMPIGDIFHYTSSNTLKNILFEHKQVVLHASRYEFLNDTMEGVYILEVYKEACEELFEDRKISKNFLDIILKAEPSNKTLFSFTDRHTNVSTIEECDHYVACFSTENDHLPMWNYYSKGSFYEAVNIGFYLNDVFEYLTEVFADKHINVHKSPIIYKKEDQKNLIKKTVLELNELYRGVDDAEFIDILSNRLFKWKLLFKSEKFEHEKEVRIIVDVAKSKKDIHVKYRTYKGYIIPYIELKMPKRAVASVRLGPLFLDQEERKQQIQILQQLLRSEDYDALAQASEIKIRY